jgi:hypothetical protein
MGKIVREDYYFDEPGKQNTDDVIEAVKKRVEATGIRFVIVASTSGETALKFARALKGKAQVVCVSESPYRREWDQEWPCLKQEYRFELEKLGVIVLDKIPYVFHNSLLEGSRWETAFPELLIKETLYSFGQGLKVAVEVAFQAVCCGVIEPYQDVIAVGGSWSGADTAIIVRATYPAAMFSKDKNKRLEIREIIAMPRKKQWYV